MTSQHIFLFPFKIEYAKDVNAEFDFKDTENLIENSGWKRKKISFDTKFSEELRQNYNNYFYFHDFFRKASFDHGDEETLSPIIKSFEKDITDDAKITYGIKGHENIELTAASISLHIFETGVGILSMELRNHKISNFDKILIINDYCRRIYPQFLDKKDGIVTTQGAFFPTFIEIEGIKNCKSTYKLTTDYFQNIKKEKNEKYGPEIAEYILDILGKNFTKKYIPVPVIDDRMYTLCWYEDDELSKKLTSTQNKKKEYKYEKSDKWYKYIFLDGKSLLCQNKNMLSDLIKKSTYERFTENNTLFGITRYSFMCLTDKSSFACNLISLHMRTIYYRMAIILLAQRASILKFSGEIAKISSLIKNDKESLEDITNHIENLDKNVIHFINSLWFTEASPQEQGIELYEKAHNIMNLPEQVKSLKAKIKELYDFVNIELEKKNNEDLKRLTIIGSIFLPVTVAIGILQIAFLFFKPIFLAAAPANFVFPILFAILLLIFCFSFTQKLYRNAISNKKYKKQFLLGKIIWKSFPKFMFFSIILFLILIFGINSIVCWLS